MRYPREVEGFTIRQAGGKYGTIKGDKGYGIFAKRDHRKGEVLGEVIGRKVHGSDSFLTHRGIQVGKDRFIEPRRFSLFFYLNHSCKPNAYVDSGQLIARRDIRRGEEIVADYSLFTDFSSWDMVCGCRTRSCRKLILPFSKLRKRSKRFVSSYLSNNS
jgi:SET domain-containing protein